MLTFYLVIIWISAELYGSVCKIIMVCLRLWMYLYILTKFLLIKVNCSAATKHETGDINILSS